MTIISKFPRKFGRAMALGAPLAMAIGLAAPASAQSLNAAEVRSLSEQVSQVQRELNVLQRHVYQGREIELAQAPSNFADTQIRVEELETRMREMNGRMEELNHRITTLDSRLDKFSSDLEFRLNTQPSGSVPASGQPGGSAAVSPPPLSPSPSFASPAPPLTAQPGAGDLSRAPSQSGILGTLPVNPGEPPPPPQASLAAPPAAPVLPPDQPLPEGTPEERYNYAFALLRSADYANAERALQAFVTAHPSHKLAGNAQYWLGETYYVRNDFNNAARAFATGVQKYPKSEKGPDNYLKLGLSLGALNKPKEACGAYDLLKREYPKAPQEVARRAEAEQKRLRCG